MKTYSQPLAILERIHRTQADRLLQKFQLHCAAGNWLDCAVLKLQKPNWTDHGPTQGLFFSVWLGDRDLAKNRFNYNLHALKFGSQKSLGVKPVAFARAFRRRFQPAGWPNVSTEYGPQTLFQGWLPFAPATFEPNVLHLINRFTILSPLLDELLASSLPIPRRRPNFLSN